MFRHRRLLSAAIIFILALPLLASAQSAPSSRPALGINLSGPADWNTELPFVDVFRFSRQWISQRRGAAWGKGPSLDLDEKGWVRKLEPDCFAETPMCTIEGGHYPSGKWTILWEGSGDVELSKGTVASNERNKLVVDIDSRTGGFFLRIRRSESSDPVRNICVLMPGVTAEQATSNPWNPTFLSRWQGTACLRFMDFQETNNSQQVHWQDRPQLADATWTRRGVPIEVMCDLANRLHCDAWFCMPHAADDDYVRQFAKLVREHLDPQLRVWIEYSNEVWNAQFGQHQYAAARGQEMKLAEKPWEAAWRYTAHRSLQIFALWDAEFEKSRERLVRVLASQSANSYVSEQIAGWEEAGKSADVLAIAPYISMNIPETGDRLSSPILQEWTVDQFLDHVEAHALPECIGWMQENRRVADKFKLRLVCYEAGQHLVGIGNAVNNDKLTDLLHQVNRHPRLGEIYDKYYAAWERSGGDLLCHFSSVSQWSKWGSWGLLQFADEQVDSIPKCKATLAWAKKLGQNVSLP